MNYKDSSKMPGIQKEYLQQRKTLKLRSLNNCKYNNITDVMIKYWLIFKNIL